MPEAATGGPSTWLAIALLLIFFTVGVWDIYAHHYGPPARTVSSIISEWSKWNTAIPFFAGFIAGHVFWR